MCIDKRIAISELSYDVSEEKRMRINMHDIRGKNLRLKRAKTIHKVHKHMANYRGVKLHEATCR